MKTLRILLVTVLVMSLTLPVYAGLDDKSDRLSSNQSSVFSPGYINATMQKTQEIIRQSEHGGATIDVNEDTLKNKLSDNVEKNANAKAEIKLQKKTGGGNVQNVSASSTVQQATDSSQVSIKIGSGTNKVYENGRMISEVIDGKKYIYAGFDKIGTTGANGTASLTAAIGKANTGDIVIVSANGTYTNLQLKSGVSIYGGYDENGDRTGKSTIGNVSGNNLIFDSMPCEINGFIFNTNVEVLYKFAGAIVGGGGLGGISIGGGGLGGGGLGGGSLGGSTTTIPGSPAGDVVMNNNVFNYGLNCHGNESGTGKLGGTVRLDKNIFSGTNTLSVSGGEQVYLTNNDFISGYGVYVALDRAVVSSNNSYFDTGSVRTQTGSGYGWSPTVTVTNPKTTQNISTLSVMGANLPSAAYYYTDIPMYSYEKMNNAENLYRSVITNGMNNSMAGVIFSGLLKSKSSLKADSVTGQMDMKAVVAVVEDSLRQSALAVPLAPQNEKAVDVALALANILKNPTEDQKLILDSMIALLNDVNKQVNEANKSPELKKAQDDLVQVVANILIAQAIPDLLKDGDVANIKGIFKDLDTERTKLLFEYNNAVKPYYSEIKKLLSKNLAILQLNNIVSKTMMQEELNKLEPNEIDRIIEKIKKLQNTSFEANYIVQEESKLHSKYIDPNKKVFEEKVKAMLEGFTKKLSKILEATKK